MKPSVRSAALMVALALTVGDSAAVRGQADGITGLLRRLEPVVQRGDFAAFMPFAADSADGDRVRAFLDTELPQGLTRVVIQERDRQPLRGTLPGDGYRIVADVFQQAGDHGRVTTWRLDLSRSGEPGTATEWLIADEERISSLDNLYRLSLNPSTQFAVRNLTIGTDDLMLTVEEGSAFVANADRGVAGLVLLGRGDVRFHPGPATERGQLKIFSGAEAIDTRFDALFLRINPSDFESLVSTDRLVARPVDAREFRRADQVFREDAPKSFGVELRDLTREAWSFLPPSGDLLAEIHTRRFDTLTYSRQASQAEDVNLFDRRRGKIIALYSSPRKLSERGPGYREGLPTEIDVLHYDVEMTLDPDRQWIDGRTDLTLRVNATSVSSISLQLAAPLVVQSVVSAEFGRLYGIRMKNQSSLTVNLPAAVLRDTELSLAVTYAGRLGPQAPDREAQGPPPAGSAGAGFDAFGVRFQPSFLYSTGTYWYAQSSASDYATANLRVTVPADLACVASGELVAGSPTLVEAKDASGARKQYTFTATQPLRYLAFVVSRFVDGGTRTIAFPPRQSGDPAEGVWYHSLDVSVKTSPGQTSRAREVGNRAVDIARFYQSIIDDVPYPTFTVALLESDLPGGHSPGYFAALNEPLPTSPYVWRDDPAAFTDYPDFFMAHELAHQWWGQAVGWRNYHEQWLSEGFAQYFAALYAQHQRGDQAFADMLRQMGQWAADQSDQGPISLGYRLGHIRSESRVFRALVYNKGAIVLHMLRRLIGDDAFFRGLRRFYVASRFEKVGTVEFRAAVEAEAGYSLERFFDRWIYGSTLPRLKLSSRIEGAEVVLKVEQLGEVFDVPLTVTLRYPGRKSRVFIPVTERVVERRVALEGSLRAIDISKDDGTLANVVQGP